MHEEELSEEAELRNSHVRRSGCLQTLRMVSVESKTGQVGTRLDPRDADSDMRRLNHADVVGTISNGQQRSVGAPLDELDNERFLKRRDSAADHCLAHDRELQEDIRAFLLQRVRQALAV